MGVLSKNIGYLDLDKYLRDKIDASHNATTYPILFFPRFKELSVKVNSLEEKVSGHIDTEEKLQALLDHLNLEIVEQKHVVREKTETKATDESPKVES